MAVGTRRGTRTADGPGDAPPARVWGGRVSSRRCIPRDASTDSLDTAIAPAPQPSTTRISPRSFLADSPTSRPKRGKATAPRPAATPRSAKPLASRNKARPCEDSAAQGCAFVSPHEHAKRLLHRSAVVPIVGRALERAVLEALIASVASSARDRGDAPCGQSAHSPRALYVCGPPGTGKTALVEDVVATAVAEHPALRVVRVNCMMAARAPDALLDVARQLEDATGSRGLSLRARVEALTQRNTPVLLLLDEVDRLSNDALRDVYAIASVRGAGVIGVANQLDLAVVSLGSAVRSLAFAPYSAEDIARIIGARLAAAIDAARQPHPGAENVPPTDSVHVAPPRLAIAPLAVEMCARKAALVGDLRKALEVMRTAVSSAAAEAAPVELRHVLAALERVFGAVGAMATASRGAARVAELNVHQKLVLAALAKLARDVPGMRPPVSVVHGRYVALAKAVRVVEPVGRSEFADLLLNAEATGVLQLSAPSRSSAADKTVSLALSPEDVASGLSDMPFLSL